VALKLAGTVPNIDQLDAAHQRRVHAFERRLRKQAELERKRALLILGVVLTLPVVILSMFFMNRFPGENFLLLLLTTPVWAVVGWEFHRAALKTLRHFGTNMDTLVSLGSTAAYIMSVLGQARIDGCASASRHRRRRDATGGRSCGAGIRASAGRRHPGGCTSTRADTRTTANTLYRTSRAGPDCLSRGA